MSVTIKVDDYDYDKAIKAVQKYLDEIEAFADEDGKVEINNIPKADDIVDTIIDIINS
jgi:hypothetical protein